jgi:GcrA cell cycle regulator
MAGMIWTAEADAELRRLHAQGKSYKAIGAALGISKNSVVGRAHRLQLPARPSPIARTTSGGGAGHAPARRTVATVAQRSEAAPPSPPVPDARPEGASAPAATPLPGRVPAEASRAPLPARITSFARKCQFPLWGFRERPPSPPLFCGATAIAGSSYCAACHARTHTTPTAWVRGNLPGFTVRGRAA